MARKTDARRRIVDSALALAAREGWASTSLSQIAAEAGMALLEVHGHFRSKTAIFEALLMRIDAEVLAGESPDGEKPRDRLFDTLMRRFDALAPHKDAVRNMLRDAPADPVGTLAAAPSLVQSMAWMLEASGVGGAGLGGRARAHLLAGIYLSVLRVWLDDDSADAMKTMAALDRRLRTFETWLGLAPSVHVAVQQNT
jgi:AcrR family transcriptional regulator